MLTQPMLQVTDTENKYWEHEGFVVSQQQLSGHLNHILRFPPVLISDPFLCDNFSALANKTSLCSFSIKYPNGNFWGQFYVEGSHAQLLPSLRNVQNHIHWKSVAADLICSVITCPISSQGETHQLIKESVSMKTMSKVLPLSCRSF